MVYSLRLEQLDVLFVSESTRGRMTGNGKSGLELAFGRFSALQSFLLNPLETGGYRAITLTPHKGLLCAVYLLAQTGITTRRHSKQVEKQILLHYFIASI